MYFDKIITREKKPRRNKNSGERKRFVIAIEYGDW